MARRSGRQSVPSHPAVTVYRLVRAKHAAHAFDGEGARRYGGRWNPPGVAMVYTARHLSLAVLELFVHLEPEVAPEDLVILAAHLPRSWRIPRLQVAELPSNWRAVPALGALQDAGEQWVRKGKSAALAVPSAVVPAEQNILINPAHPAFSAIRLGKPQSFSFDPRMWK